VAFSIVQPEAPNQRRHRFNREGFSVGLRIFVPRLPRVGDHLPEQRATAPTGKVSLRRSQANLPNKISSSSQGKMRLTFVAEIVALPPGRPLLRRATNPCNMLVLNI
jgi:hypothetical protein